jgi:hypothetical protein
MRDKLKWSHPIGKIFTISLILVTLILGYIVYININWQKDWQAIIVFLAASILMSACWMSALQRH